MSNETLSPPAPARAMRSVRAAGYPGLRPALIFLLLTIVFSISYTQAPLFTSNQNQYFLHGYALAGRGFLAQDWLANTLDPTPAFSALVAFMARTLPAETFYLFYALQLGIYVVCLFSILDPFFHLRRAREKSCLFLALVTLVHSAAWRFALSRTLGANWSYILEDGVADQRLLGSVFEPSTFGVLLVLSITLFLRQKPYWAAVSAAMAATFHPTYLLSAGVLTAAYMGVSFFDGVKGQRMDQSPATGRAAASAENPAEASTNPEIPATKPALPAGKAAVKPLGIGLVALLVVTPILVYVYINFGNTPPETTAQAQAILVNFRIPHHARVDWWFDGTAVAKLIMVVAALYRIRHTRLFPVLLTCTLAAAGLTLIQVVTGNVTLALIFPWRISTFVVPLSTAILLAWLVDGVWARFLAVSPRGQKFALWFGVGLLALCMLVGTIRFGLDLQRKVNILEQAMLRTVETMLESGQVYLTPVKMQDFRLATGAPVYVDFKSIPYRDSDVLEWRRRLALADTFYQEGACDVLKTLAGEGVTHAVLPSDSPGLDCPDLAPVYDDGRFSVQRVSQP